MIHLVYAGNPLSDVRRSPDTITQELYRRLKNEFGDVTFHQWDVASPARFGKNDIVIGHPHPNKQTPMWEAVNAKRMFLLFPFHHAMPESNAWADHLVKQCDKYFAITGKYWMDTIGESEFASWRPKMHRLDMAINPEHFKFRKWNWNAPHERTFLAITDMRPEKGQKQLMAMALKNNLRLVHIGPFPNEMTSIMENGLPYFRHISWSRMDANAAAELCDECDYFIHAGVSDANPTTVLEAASWGLPVICTVTSGYYKNSSTFILDNIDMGKMDLTGESFETLQVVSEGFLGLHSVTAARHVEQTYTWDNFCDPIISAIKEVL
jgi:glycosyltransferase involved in cell wall biosynthesis